MHIGEGLEGHVGIDGRGAKAQQGGKVVDFAHVAGLDDEVGLSAVAGPDKMVMDGAGGQDGGDRRMGTVHAAIRQEQNGVAIGNGGLGGAADRIEGMFQGTLATIGLEDDVDGLGLEVVLVDVAEPLQLEIGEHRLCDRNAATVLRRLAEQILEATDIGPQIHDELLADRVDRGICDLGKELLEVVGELLGGVGEHGQRIVRAHGTERLLAVTPHVDQDLLDILEAEAEGLLPPEERGGIGLLLSRGRGGQVIQIGHVALDPVGVGLALADLVFDLVIGDDASLGEVGHEDLTGLQASAQLHLGGIDVDAAGFRCHDHQVILGDAVAGGTQSVAVEGGADDDAVGKADGGGAIPRLHHRGVEFVEALLRGAHGLVVLPCFGHQHHHDVGQGASAQHQHFDGHIQIGGIGGMIVADGEEHLQLGGGEVGARKQRFAGTHPVDVAAHRIDFAVMGDVAEGLGQPPGGEGVGREAGMHGGESRDQSGVGEILIVHRHLSGHQLSFVVDGLVGAGDDIEGVAQILDGGLGDVLGVVAQDHQATVEGGQVCVGGLANEELLDSRFGLAGSLAEVAVVGGNLAVAQ